LKRSTTQTKARAGATLKTPAKRNAPAARSTTARSAAAANRPQTKPATKARAGTQKRASAKSGSTPKPQATRARAKPQTKPARLEESAIRSDRTAQQILAAAAKRTPLGDGETVPQTVAVNFMENFAHECGRHLRPRGSGKCTVAGFNLILERKTKPQTKERVGYNPQTKQPMTVPAKPARIVVKARVGKRFHDAIGLSTS
jgi:hypothetical protein